MAKSAKKRPPRPAARRRAARPAPPVILFDQSILGDLRDLLLPADFAAIVAKALETLPATLADLRRTWKDGDREETGRQAHKLAGLSGNFGGMALMEAARQVENACKKGQTRQLERQIRGLDDLLQPTLDALTQCAAGPAK